MGTCVLDSIEGHNSFAFSLLMYASSDILELFSLEGTVPYSTESEEKFTGWMRILCFVGTIDHFFVSSYPSQILTKRSTKNCH
jgi:hypothetical protein